MQILFILHNTAAERMFYIAASDENGNSKNTIVGQIISNVKLQDAELH